VAGSDDEGRLKDNRRAWDLRTRVHQESAFYDVESFKRGRNSLRPFELDELGDVTGRSLLHLQCHFGMDTLSWARLGAHVTGVDFSEDAIETARALAAEIGVAARFVCANLYDLPTVLDGEFDIVVSTYGIIGWLPDLEGWARVAAHFLKPGGTFCLVEIHPLISLFDEIDGELKLTASLFDSGPFESESVMTYADGLALPAHPEHNWRWPLSRVVTALSAAGLRIERLREFPVDVRQRLPSMVKGDDGYWRLPGDPLPLLFTIVATRPL
jgi:2-polyprenyl-3-methyl-5-hydroxy-6-metoxy-1,4-benzoquinol methylase